MPARNFLFLSKCPRRRNVKQKPAKVSVCYMYQTRNNHARCFALMILLISISRLLFGMVILLAGIVYNAFGYADYCVACFSSLSTAAF